MKKTDLRMLVEAGIMIALSQILSYITVFTMPAGGSITAGSMVPLLVFAIRWGAKNGMLAGAVYGVLQFILGPKWSFHPVSLLFDYPVAFAMLGLAGFFKKTLAGTLQGIFLALSGRFICHVISGVVVFASYAPEGQHPLVYSILYNGSYLLPEFIISVILVNILLRYVPFFRERL